MTVLIKGMKLPKKGYKDLRIHADGSWSAYAETVPYNDIYGAVVEVPTPHGRLIDADEFFDKIPPGDIEHDEKISRTGAIADVCTWVLSAPTVIEAEENNNGKLHEL